MKKIININLSGRVIPIEDSAYEKLQSYIESLRRYFANEEGRDEIINDIESRIAELMNERVRKGAASVTDNDVDEIIIAMGRPEDFDAEEVDVKGGPEPTAAYTGTKQSRQEEETTSQRRTRRRLYRDSSDKMIGGVCSGIANYLNIDPTIVRILFAIVTFGGFGLGFLIYILLWIILPDKDLEEFRGKRLFRNPDDRILGGVAGGLAAYFDKKSSTIRLIFAAPIMLSILLSILRGIQNWHDGFDFFPNIVFGSLSGTFILAYVILWMVLPEARNTYDKMEMRGEKVDVNAIRQNVKEGMGNFKDRMKSWGEEVKESAQNIGSKAKEFAGTRGKAFAHEVSESASKGGRGIGHAIAVLFKVFFLFIVGSIAFGLFVGLIALIFGGIAWWPVNNFLWTSNTQQLYAWGTLIFFLFVPLLGFIVWLIRRIIRVRSRSSYMGWIFGVLWTIGWVVAILFVTSVMRDFREYEHKDEPVNVKQPVHGKLIVAVSQPELEYTGRFDWINDGGEGWDLSSDTLKLSTVRFNIKASLDSGYHVILKRFSFGRTEEEALNRANKIVYSVFARDSILDLSSGYAIDKESKFRGQQVEIEIQVPVGKKIRFDESVNEKLNPVKFKVKRTLRNRRVVNIEVDEDNYFHFRSGVDYIMGIDGSLKDPLGNTPSNDYRYEGVDTTINIQQEIEKEKQRKEESERKIRELENKQKEAKPNSLKNLKIDEKNALAGSPSPVFSMVGWLN